MRLAQFWRRPLVAVIALALTGIQVAYAAPSRPTHPNRQTSSARPFALGDSIMEGAASELARRGIVVNAIKGRQFNQGIQTVQSMRAAHALPSEIVIGLGANGPFTPGQFDQMMQALRGVRRVVLVPVKEPLFWETQVNAVIRAGVRRWPNARIADWYAYAAAHPAVVCCDGMHIGPAGARAYAQIVVAALR